MFTFISFAFFTGLVAVISWLFTRKEKLSSKEGYFLAGRNLSAVMIAGSLLLTNLSTEQLAGLNGSAYKYGMEVMAWEVVAALAMVAMALFFLPKYLKMGIFTITQFLEARFDKDIRIICSALFLLLYITTLLPIVLYTGAINLEKIFDISILLQVDRFTAIILMVVFIGCLGSIYAIFGGLKAVAVSDTLNGIGLIIGGLSIPALAFYSIGNGNIFDGVSEVYNTIPEHFNSIGDADSEVPFSVLFTGMFIPQVFYWTMNQSIIQRTLGAKNLAEGQKGVLIAAIIKIFIPIIMVLPGIIAFYYFPNLESQDLAYPELIKKVLPKEVLGIFVAILVGAILSTFNSALNSASTLFSIDIYKEYINKKAKDKDIVNTGRITAAVLAVLVVFIAPFIDKLGTGVFNLLQELSSFFSMPILVLILSALLLKQVSSKAIKIGIPVGILIYLFTKLLDFHWLHMIALSFVITLTLILFLSKKFPRKTQFIIKDEGYVEIKSWKYVKHVSLFVVICSILTYILFSPLVLGA